MSEVHDAVVARMLQEDPQKRPVDAFEARRLLFGVRWPDRIWARVRPGSADHAARSRTDRPPAIESARLTAPLGAGDGRDTAARRHDAWLDRDVLVLPADDATLARARAFARAGHPALPTVLRVDRETGEIWIAAPQGRALADEPRGLSPGQVARLREAIEALHVAGGAHGRVDFEHLYWLDGEVTLAYPRGGVAEDAQARDREALTRLG